MQNDRLLTRRELMDFLKISEVTLNKWMRSGYIPYLKFKRAVRFRKSDIDVWLESKVVK